MYYKKISPHTDLSPYIECYYVWKHSDSLLPLLEVETPPSGFGAMVFNLADPYLVGTHLCAGVQIPPVFFTGQSSRSYILNISGLIDIVGVVFKPAALYTFFGLPMQELVDKRIDARLVLGRKIACIWEQFGEMHFDNERIGILNDFFLDILTNRDPVWDEVDHATEIILAKKGLVSLSDLYQQFSISKRQFQRNFQKKVGLSPKRYTRLRRFSEICNYLVNQRIIDWHEVVMLGGYHDQSHFIKDFLAFMDENPSLYYSQHKELKRYLEKEPIG